jgi:hypothetical protein
MDKEEKYYSDFYFTLVESFLAASAASALLITTANTLIDNLTFLFFIY